jgi:hypothetical protein
MNKPYYILSPSYQSNSGGIKVLYELVKRLNARGQRAYIVNGPAQVPVDAIAVYPEIYKGNPFGCKTVARYVLNSPGKIGGDKVYDDKELVFSYYELYNKDIQNKIQGMLFLPITERDIFKDHGLERKGSCYYIGKGPKKDLGVQAPADSLLITSSNPSKREDLAHIFNTRKVLYCYDYSTVMCQEAALCGCPVVLLSGNLEEHKNAVFKGYGCCDNIGNIQDAIDTMLKVKERFDELEIEADLQLDNFIKITQRGR